MEKTEGTFKIQQKKKPEVVQTDDQKRAAIKEPLIDTSTDIPKVTLKKNHTEPDIAKVVVQTEPEETVEQVVEETPTLTEVVKEEVVAETPVAEAAPVQPVQPALPENIEKLVNFMQDTGGDIQDYVRLNTNYDDVDKSVLVKEYYKNTKPHLSAEEIDFVIDDTFAFDEDIDEDNEIRKKKIAYKEEVAKAKTFLEETKNKYYDDIKLKSTGSSDQTEAESFFNRFKENEAQATKNQEIFRANTSKLFSQDFEGFDFNVGDKTFRMSVPNVEKVSEKQQDISNFINKFTGDSGVLEDTAGYHKALYAASNPDKMANHFYEQGKADAIREITNKSNNVSTEARQAAPKGDVKLGKWTIKGVSDGNSSKLKIKKC
ncbi:MAG: hypothetical protein HOG49_01655 [Candidatus Scalindua sp.]|nr:hypothetical protein [Candidatus Scalindua sp.]